MTTKVNMTPAMRLLAAALALLLTLSMGVFGLPETSVSAVETITTNFHTGTTYDSEKQTVTVNNLENGTVVTAYRIIDVNFASADAGSLQTATPTYIWNSAVGAWLKSQTTTKITVTNGENGKTYYLSDLVTEYTNGTDTVYGVSDVFTSMMTGDDDGVSTGTEGDVSTVLQQIMAAIKSNTISSDSVEKITSGGATGDETNGYSTTLSLYAGVYLAQPATTTTTAGTTTGLMKIYNPTSINVLPMYQSSGWSLMVNASEESGTYQSNNTVSAKGLSPTIEKTVTSDDNSVAVGETVDFQLQILVPKYPDSSTQATVSKIVLVKDTMTDGLTFTANSLKVYAESSSATGTKGNEIENSWNDDNSSAIGWKVVENGGTYKDAGGTEVTVSATFEVLFSEGFITKYGGETIYVTYSATVNETAVTESINNTAALYYNNDPYSTEISSIPASEETVKLYTYGVTIDKFGDSTSPTAKITDGKTTFELYGVESGTVNADALKFSGYKAEGESSVTDGVYVYDSTNGSATLTVNTSGTLELAGLAPGTYYLKETASPDGYSLPNGGFTFTIADAADSSTGANDGNIDENTLNFSTSGTAKLYKDGSVTNGYQVLRTVTNDSNRSGSTFNNVSELQIEVLNSVSTFTLPITGGMGTVIFTLAGLVLMAGAVAFVVVYRKKQAK